MTTLSFDYFFRQLKAGCNINETCFYFDDDPNEEEHYLGCYSKGDAASYWVGGCDIEDGTDFETAEELVNAPIFDGKSLKSRWDNIKICSIESLPVEDWLECMEHVG